MDIKKNTYHMLYLASCALNRCVPNTEKLKNIDLAELYQICKFHSMTSIVCTALESANILKQCSGKELVKEWRTEKAKAIHKEMLFDKERKEILEFMDEKGIWYMPLKGIVLKEFYPAAGMRQMADNDILYDKDYRNDLHSFMQARGYSVFSEKNGYHEIYKKPPSYVFEMHTELFGIFHEKYQLYYADVKNRLIKNKNSNCGYRFSDEDFYIYFIAHEYRHFNSGGTGLRSLMDIYVYISGKGSTLNWNYIDAELKKIGLDEFEKQNRALSIKLFSAPPERVFELEMTDSEQKLFGFFAHSGTYGTVNNRLNQKLRKIQTDENKITATTRMKYFFKRLFPGVDWYKKGAPFCYKHKWSIPFFWLYRLLRTVFVRQKKIIDEIRRIINS